MKTRTGIYSLVGLGVVVMGIVLYGLLSHNGILNIVPDREHNQRLVEASTMPQEAFQLLQNEEYLIRISGSNNGYRIREISQPSNPERFREWGQIALEAEGIGAMTDELAIAMTESVEIWCVRANLRRDQLRDHRAYVFSDSDDSYFVISPYIIDNTPRQVWNTFTC